MPSRYTEDELIARVFAPIAGAAALGLKDDAALIGASPEPTVATVDMLVAGVHFFPDDPPGAVARKALRINLSDLAAKGAAPVGFLLSLALPTGWTNDWLAAFAAGLAEDAATYAAPLIGGDTTATPGPLTISITALGRASRFVPRTGAKAGDAIYVSGTIGDAALGLAMRRDATLAARLSPAARAHLLDRYLLPRPRLDLLPLLRDHANAAMDVSDGLAGDLAKLCAASGVGAVVEAPMVPLSDAAREAIALAPGLFETALTGGDDYEILFTAAPGFSPPDGVARIGEIAIGPATLEFRSAAKKPLIFKKLSFSHF
ncbi:thiamine-phosphate kinase [Methylocystis sp. MJC1]|jgi:thiamine-monophosphate kinase|uniref:thiamine-phosphate kinase n=1 Tax=Methylocystis sp. MJC1 TaxID=2654282 RepID=UPI0013ED1E23|nr:thiamine-phosphate kinase [Methylocystis sp. MJC1]KAF2992745.1 Thiamine-monophosphate kinase [Methylocystis sp. MJC1]MBU6526708.1 thiamine-phosphate kinase [Methylocystis sp. MJC1]UZX13695.1 thiamine-phosphate kinase [Methylocystis sp. MJC1]